MLQLRCNYSIVVCLLQLSMGSENTNQSVSLSLGLDDSSNDALVIVDDQHNTFPPGTPPVSGSNTVCLITASTMKSS